LHSSSAALMVKLRFTCPTSRAGAAPARAQTTRKSSVLKPRCSVWKWTSVTPVSVRIGGMLRTSSCASQYAATCCSKNTPSPPVEIGLETRFWLGPSMQSTKCSTVSLTGEAVQSLVR